MEKKFENPTLTMVVFENEDVITVSGGGVLSKLFSYGRNALPALNPFGE